MKGKKYSCSTRGVRFAGTAISTESETVQPVLEENEAVVEETIAHEDTSTEQNEGNKQDGTEYLRITPKLRKHLRRQGMDTSQIVNVADDGNGHLLVTTRNGKQFSFARETRSFERISTVPLSEAVSQTPREQIENEVNEEVPVTVNEVPQTVIETQEEATVPVTEVSQNEGATEQNGRVIDPTEGMSHLRLTPKLQKHLRHQGMDTSQILDVVDDGNGHLLVTARNGNRYSGRENNKGYR